MHKNLTPTLSRFFALALAVSLALPNSAWALRGLQRADSQSGLEELENLLRRSQPKQPITTGLEEKFPGLQPTALWSALFFPHFDRRFESSRADDDARFEELVRLYELIKSRSQSLTVRGMPYKIGSVAGYSTVPKIFRELARVQAQAVPEVRTMADAMRNAGRTPSGVSVFPLWALTGERPSAEMMTRESPVEIPLFIVSSEPDGEVLVAALQKDAEQFIVNAMWHRGLNQSDAQSIRDRSYRTEEIHGLKMAVLATYTAPIQQTRNVAVSKTQPTQPTPPILSRPMPDNIRKRLPADRRARRGVPYGLLGQKIELNRAEIEAGWNAGTIDWNASLQPEGSFRVKDSNAAAALGALTRLLEGEAVIETIPVDSRRQPHPTAVPVNDLLMLILEKKATYEGYPRNTFIYTAGGLEEEADRQVRIDVQWAALDALDVLPGTAPVREAFQGSFLAALVSREAFQEALLQANVLLPALAQNLSHSDAYVRGTALDALAELASREAFQEGFETLGLTPAQIGFPSAMDWNSVGRAERIYQGLSSRPGFSAFGLGGRAFVRRKLMRAAASISESALQQLGERWTAHSIQMEALDRLAGLPSTGAEIHLPVEGNTGKIEQLATQLSTGVGPHAMVPWILEAEERQLDVRLLPTYPALFRRLLAEPLRDPALENYRTVGAHYSVGLDLGKELVTVALALYYGDKHYLEAPTAGSTEGGVGFPGVWTYRGQSLDLTTGRVTDQNQSNLHLRPLRTFVGDIPLDLFQADVDRLSWLAAAAAAPPGDPRQHIYQEFTRKWEAWLRNQGGETLMKTVRAAMREIGSKSGAGVSPALDKASADLLAAMYKTPEKGALARRDLANILKETLEKLEETAWGSAAAAKAIRAYRESDGLTELDRTLAKAVETVAQEIFSTETQRGSSKETRFLNVLSALDPAKAAEVRAALAAGLEEKVPAENMAVVLAIFTEIMMNHPEISNWNGLRTYAQSQWSKSDEQKYKISLKQWELILEHLQYVLVGKDGDVNALPYDKFQMHVLALGMQTIALTNLWKRKEITPQSNPGTILYLLGLESGTLEEKQEKTPMMATAEALILPPALRQKLAERLLEVISLDEPPSAEPAGGLEESFSLQIFRTSEDSFPVAERRLQVLFPVTAAFRTTWFERSQADVASLGARLQTVYAQRLDRLKLAEAGLTLEGLLDLYGIKQGTDLPTTQQEFLVAIAPRVIAELLIILYENERLLEDDSEILRRSNLREVRGEIAGKLSDISMEEAVSEALAFIQRAKQLIGVSRSGLEENKTVIDWSDTRAQLFQQLGQLGETPRLLADPDRITDVAGTLGLSGQFKGAGYSEGRMLIIPDAPVRADAFQDSPQVTVYVQPEWENIVRENLESLLDFRFRVVDKPDDARVIIGSDRLKNEMEFGLLRNKQTFLVVDQNTVAVVTANRLAWLLSEGQLAAGRVLYLYTDLKDTTALFA